MMIAYLIKNNLKLMFRNKWTFLVLLVAPFLTIALLTSAFRSLMSVYEAPDEFSVGYRETGSFLSDSMDTVKDAGRDAGILLREYPDGDPSELMEKNELSAFIEFEDGKYTLYKSDDHKTEGEITEYFLGRVMNESANTLLDMISPEAGLKSALPVTQTNFMPAIESNDYYGIIYIVYFGCLGITCAVGVLSNEKKYNIEKRYRICSLSSADLYFSRLIPAVAVSAASLLFEAVLTACVYDIHWGVPVMSAFIMLVMIIASISVGFFFYNLTKNIAATIVGFAAVIWIMGFFGGSFENYMYSSTPDTLKAISPIYHVNRALVELSCMGHSSYVSSALIYCAVIAAAASVLAIATDMIRKRCTA